MNTMRILAIQILVVHLLVGCGTLGNLAGRNGERYLAASADCQAIEHALHPNPYDCIQLGPIFTLPWIICWGADVPVSLVTDTILLPYDHAIGRKRGFKIQVIDDIGAPVPLVSIKGYSRRRVSGTTDQQGRYFWASGSRSIEWVEFSKNGYYNTTQYPSSRGDISSELAATRTNTLPVTLKKIRDPIPMYAKQASVELPASSGSYGYDLMIGDLLKPYGKGEAADFIIHIAKEIKPYGRNMDISFSTPEDGIQRYDSAEARHRDGPRQSDFIFPYEAPESGYYPSLLEADAAADAITPHGDSQNRNYHSANYIFRTRTGNTPNGLYGRIFGPFGFIIRDTNPIVQFTYYLNPSGTRNLEWDSTRNLISNVGHSEYGPRAK